MLCGVALRSVDHRLKTAQTAQVSPGALTNVASRRDLSERRRTCDRVRSVADLLQNCRNDSFETKRNEADMQTSFACAEVMPSTELPDWWNSRMANVCGRALRGKSDACPFARVPKVMN